MRSSKLLLVLFVFGVSAIFAAATASADVANLTTNTLLFHDDFSGLGTSVSHAAYEDLSGDYDPVAATGTWAIIGDGASGQTVQVTDHVGSGDPGPAPGTGSNYLRLRRTAGIGGDAEADFAAQTIGGEHIQIATMLNINSAGIGGQLLVYRNTGALLINLATNYAGHSVHNFGGGDTGLTFTPNVWQKWQIDYNVYDETFSLSIGGATASGLAVSSAGAPAALMFTQDANVGPMYVSESPITLVPEPTSILLLVSGMIGLLAYAWRKRK